MKTIRETKETEKGQYQNVASHITQSWQWGEFREKTGVRVYRFGEFENSKLVAAWQIFLHRIPYTNFNIGYLPRSPLPNAKILNFIKEISQRDNCVFVKIEPDVKQLLKAPMIPKPFVKGRPILPVHTFLLNLTLPEKELLKKMHEKTRYNVKLAQKQGIKVEEKNNDESLEIFLKILEQTQKRQGFYTHPKGYFRQQWQILKPEKMIHLLMAYFHSEPVAGILLLRFKDVLYYTYGASSEVHREKMPNHLLHWEAIKLGKKLGCKIYDFWGAYWEKPDPSDPWYGLYRFKVGFGGNLVSYVVAYDLVINSFLYQIYQAADFLRWKFLKLKRGLLRQ